MRDFSLRYRRNVHERQLFTAYMFVTRKPSYRLYSRVDWSALLVMECCSQEVNQILLLKLRFLVSKNQEATM